MKRFLFLMSITVFLSYIGVSSILTQTRIKRLVFAAGSNYGGPKRVKLQYAVSDAKAFLKVMKSMGGVHPDGTVLLIEPKRQKFLDSLKTFNKKIKALKKTFRRIEVMFYYSGHADDSGIMLGKERVSYKEIRNFIKEFDSDVKIAILDSCSSGALTRLKGGSQKKPFLLDSSFDMKGYAFMTSSSANEASQESDKIKGSFFTHFLVAGLRGAADLSNDGRITLSEAYQYAYKETLGRTEKTISGPQHPNYFIKMSGTGDVVVTDIRKSSSRMIINSDVSGRLSIRDYKNDLVVELNKPSGRIMELGLDKGNYYLLNEHRGKLFEAKIALVENKSMILTKSLFKKIKREYAVARGGYKYRLGKSRKGYIVYPFIFSLYPDIYNKHKTIHNYSIGLLGVRVTRQEGMAISLGPNIVEEDASWGQFSVIGNITGGDMKGIQAAYIMNVTQGKMSGIQASSIFNIVGDDMKGIQGSGVFNIVSGNVTGIQGAGIFNINAGAVEGLQGSGIFNINAGQLIGIQGAGIFNVNNGDLKGVQGAGIFNINNGYLEGMELAGIFNIQSGYMEGMQLAGIFNHSGNGKSSSGAQVAGIYNMVTGSLDGGQVAGIFNHVSSELAGIQIAGIHNYATKSQGVQIATINISGESTGAQIGVLNISAGNTKGLQLGVINIADEQQGVPIGLINYSNNGSIDLQVWRTNMVPVNAGIRFRSNYVYTLVSIGGLEWEKINSTNDVSNIKKGDLMARGFHVGAHIPIYRFYISGDVGYVEMDRKKYFNYEIEPDEENTEDEHHLQVRAILGVELPARFSLFAGVGANWEKAFMNSHPENNYSLFYMGGVSFKVFGK